MQGLSNDEGKEHGGNAETVLDWSRSCGRGNGGLTACGSDSGSGGEGGGTNMAFAWWGNDVRTKNTNAAIAAYRRPTPA